MVSVFLAVCILALSSFASALVYVDSCERAYDECAWQFKGDKNRVPTYSLGTVPDVPFTAQIVAKDQNLNLGVLNSNNIHYIVPEFIRPNGRAVPITSEGNPKFTPSHFKPYSIKSVRGSFVGHQTFLGDQKKVASGQCIRVFFSQYQVLTNKTPFVVTNNVNVTKYDYKCVVFRTY